MERLPKWLRRRYKVGYALACGNTFDTKLPAFFTLRMAEKYADHTRAGLSRYYHTFAVFITDDNDPERGDVYGTDET